MAPSKNKLHQPTILNEDSIRIAESFLSQKDAILSELIQAHGPCTLGLGEAKPFVRLVNSIIGQQLSTKAAKTIRERLRHGLGEITPNSIALADNETLRACGLSGAKIRYIKNLSLQVTNKILDFSVFPGLPAETAVKELTKISGVGQWTAEMFAMFAMRHSNILSLGDAGLKRAVKKLYGDTAELAKIGKEWEPYCSVASWYLWRHLDAN